MRVDVYVLLFESQGLTCHLWSPWRCSQLEHRLFDAVKSLSDVEAESAPDELQLHIADAKTSKLAMQALARVLKGWQEEATDSGTERRSWRWLVEADTDSNGYDMNGEKAVLWLYPRLSLDRGGPGEAEKGEDVDLNGFGLSIWNEEAK